MDLSRSRGFSDAGRGAFENEAAVQTEPLFLNEAGAAGVGLYGVYQRTGFPRTRC